MQPTPLYLPAIRRWLMLCAALVVLMVAIGGVTRLTESGLSIVEWKLVSGTLPPLSQAAWVKEFEDYKTSPQFQKVNRDFCIEDFRQIYWLEYLHRLLGRIIGIAVLGGTVYFAALRQLPRPLFLRMVSISALVGAQGIVGWVMVASGLHDEPRVAPVKLALHLLLAFALLASLLWTRWQVMGSARDITHPRIARESRSLLALILVQISFGALVAGLRAGLTYNTFPLMDGQWLPRGLYLLVPWWKNHLENVLTVQFQHRLGAMLVVAAALWLVWYAWNKTAHRDLLRWMLVAMLGQFALGVATLLTHVDPLLASAHQLMALLLFTITLRLAYLAPIKGFDTRPARI